MGVYCPSSRVSFAFDFPQEKGPVAFISQSGGNSFCFVRAAANRGIRFSKVVSYGNACDINETDLLEYLTHDPETKLITAYIEGTKDGVRFFRVLRDKAKAKPAVVNCLTDPDVLHNVWMNVLGLGFFSFQPWEDLPEEARKRIIEEGLVPPWSLPLCSPDWIEALLGAR